MRTSKELICFFFQAAWACQSALSVSEHNRLTSHSKSNVLRKKVWALICACVQAAALLGLAAFCSLISQDFGNLLLNNLAKVE
ncbi:hypothetical protein PR048_022687 [Dryococelus australis]|uniref:Uncharacterized protein n=1 Tax=Dryococelus australis TaxID=614101 RepID=A0ABQ9GS11_9NEOP|nr:hypothetical protein PR048_022687 [Dryococelus australis]